MRHETEVIEKLLNIPTQVGLGDRFSGDRDLILIQNPYKIGYNLRSSMIATGMISIPITLEQLITAVQQLQPDERAQVARALVEMDLRSDLTALIQELYAQTPIDDITDDDVMAEIKAVRQQSHQA